MDYAHAQDLLNSSDESNRLGVEHWVNMHRTTFPRIGIGAFLSQDQVVRELRRDHLDYSALPEETLVEGRFFAFVPWRFPRDEASPEWEESFKQHKDFKKDTVKKTKTDLLRLKCAVVWPSALDIRIDGVDTCQSWLFLPGVKPKTQKACSSAIGAPTPLPYEPDAEGAIVFYAYLLHKKLISEQDVPISDNNLLGLAKSVKYQNKVREGLGEPLLDATAEALVQEQGHGILHADRAIARATRYSDFKNIGGKA